MVENDVWIRSMVRQDMPELLRLMEGIVKFERGTDFRLTEAELLHRGHHFRTYWDLCCL